jgi:hypothetical protein
MGVEVQSYATVALYKRGVSIYLSSDIDLGKGRVGVSFSRDSSFLRIKTKNFAGPGYSVINGGWSRGHSIYLPLSAKVHVRFGRFPLEKESGTSYKVDLKTNLPPQRMPWGTSRKAKDAAAKTEAPDANGSKDHSQERGLESPAGQAP